MLPFSFKYTKNIYIPTQSEKSDLALHEEDILENKANLLLTSIEFTIKNLLNSLKNKVKYIFDDNLNKIQQNITIIEHLSPIQLLKRGYFRILSNNLEQFNLKNIKVNDEITVVGYNEKLTAKVVKKENV